MSSERGRWLNRWSALAALLMVGYAGLLWLAAHPDVSPAYRAYYIDRTSDMPPSWDLLRRPPVLEPGASYAFDAPQILRAGWSTPEPAHVWTLGPYADLLVSLPEGLSPGAQLVLEGMVLGGAQQVVLTAEGRSRRHDLRAGDPLVLTLQEAAPGPLRLHLALPQAASPGPQDPRVLGFALQRLRLVP